MLKINTVLPAVLFVRTDCYLIFYVVMSDTDLMHIGNRDFLFHYRATYN